MASDIVLSSALRTNLLSLQSTQALIDRTQLRLSTGRKVNSALDSPLNFFASQALSNRATDLSRLLDGIGQSISTVEQANNGVEALTTLVEQAQATATSAFEAAQSASGNISLVGDEDLRNIQDLTTGTAIENGDKLVISITDPNDPSAPAISGTVTIGAGDSINDLINDINNLNSSSEEVVRADLDSNGRLRIQALNNGNLDINFSDASGGTATGEVVAQALGLDGEGFEVDIPGGTNTFRVSRVADSGLVINLFEGSNDLADRGDTLSGLINADGDNIFDNGGNATATFQIRVNGDDGTEAATVDIDIGTGSTDTLQDVIDRINTDASINGFIRAEFNEDSGEFRITPVNSDVQSIDIVTSANAVVQNTGFGSDITSNSQRRFTFGGGAGELARLQSDFEELRAQIDSLVEDSTYRGVNLLSGDILETFFNEDRSNSLQTEGQNLTSSGLGINAANFASAESAEQVLSNVRAALQTVRNFGSTLANDLSIIQARESFTERTVDTLNTGSDKLTLADQNEEGANLLALQTRQQLGVTSLSLASQSQQAVLRLF